MKSNNVFLLLILIVSSLIYLAQASTINSHDSQEAINTFNYPSNLDVKWENKGTSSSQVYFLGPEDYSLIRGVTTFRGNNFRNTGSYGTANIESGKMVKLWSISIGYIDKWTGVGWNGQPAIVQWDYNLQNNMNLYNDKKYKKGLKEIIYAALDGKVYFLDLDDGSPTRPCINIGAPIKGSVSIDPRGYPLLYVGQGLDEVNGQSVAIGYRIFNLYDQKELFFLDGKDNFALRDWGAFDSNVLIDKDNDVMLVAGENGIFYKVTLNTSFDPINSRISIKPEVVRYRYQAAYLEHQGIENSIAAFKNFVYFADNGGLIQALDLNSMAPAWIRDVTDDTDSTIVIEEDESGVFLFTGCEVDKQGATGKAIIRKINAVTGELIWEKSYKAYHHTTVNGGVLATPIIGKKEINDLVIFNIARHRGLSKGLVVALDKLTGKEVWNLPLNRYSWSSPIDIYTIEGKAFMVLGDSGGNIILIDARTGRILDSLLLESNIEGSPAIFEDILVIGTRGKKIFGIKVQ